MKKGFQLCTMALAVGLLAIEMVKGAEPPKPIPVTAEQREKMLRETGGPIMTPEKGPWIAVVNAQSKIGKETYDGEIEHAKNMFKFSFHTSSTTNEWRKSARLEVMSGATFAVVVGDIEGESSLVLLPTEQIALVNVAALASPDEEVFNDRFHKEFLRGLAYLFGIGNSASAMSIMKPVKSVAELDALPARHLGPDSLSLSMRLARDRGMTVLRKVPYILAVKQGWAPAPTNDIQQAVWDRVMAEKASVTNAPAEKVSAPAK